MIKEIKKPKIKFNFDVFDNEKFYFDDERNEYINVTTTNYKYYFNLEGNIHRIGKPAICSDFCNFEHWKKNGKLHRLDGPALVNNSTYFYIENINYSEINYAILTDHLICKICKKFCKQGCF